MAKDWQVSGGNSAAPFTLKLYRGEGMVLIAMNWRDARPSRDFVGFAIECRPPGSDSFYPVKNRMAFPGRAKPLVDGEPPERYPSTEAPFQTFRWVHFPYIADTPGLFTYRVTAKYMDAERVLRPGRSQQAKISLYGETMPGLLNVAFTRGYVSSQSFVDKFGGAEAFPSLIPGKADDGPTFIPTHPLKAAAYRWMGFEARAKLLDLLDAAIEDEADVDVVAYELNLPELIHRLAAIGPKLRIIIDDSKNKGATHAAETVAAAALQQAGAKVVRQHMQDLQHNKMVIVDGPNVKTVLLGSTNLSWRGIFVQSNNAVFVSGAAIVAQQRAAFKAYWESADAAAFRASPAAQWLPLHVPGLEAEISMSPHAPAHRTQVGIATAINDAKSSVFYSLAFLSQTTGDVTTAVHSATNRADLFVYGISDKRAGIILQQPDGNPAPVSAAALGAGMPEPFRSEAKGGGGVKMHHKFVVIDFNQPTARVYTGSYNFSDPADKDNGENLLVIRDERIATAYAVEALRIFDCYQFRVSKKARAVKGDRMDLLFPPQTVNDLPWWDKYYTEPLKSRDRKLFA